MRYAASDYLAAQKTGDPDLQKVVLAETLAHCRRAEYDAIDASIVSAGRNIVEFKRYSQTSVVSTIPNYPDSFAKAMVLLNDFSPEDAPRNVSSEDLGAYGENLDELVALWQDIAVKQPLVEKLDFERRLELKHAARRLATGRTRREKNGRLASDPLSGRSRPHRPDTSEYGIIWAVQKRQSNWLTSRTRP